MALVRIDEKTLVQKVKTFIIGSEKPNWATRLSVMVGFGIWLFYTAYFTIILLSILFVDTLENPELIKNTFAKIGGPYNFNIKYSSMSWTAIDVIFYHALFVIALFLISLLGLVYVYRRKKMGYILYLIGNTLAIVFTFYFLGSTYVKEQISIIDQYIVLGMTIYFFIAMFLLKRDKIDKPINPQQQS